MLRKSIYILLWTSSSNAIISSYSKVFAEGREVVEDLPRSDRPSTSSTAGNVDKENGTEKPSFKFEGGSP